MVASGMQTKTNGRLLFITKSFNMHTRNMLYYKRISFFTKLIYKKMSKSNNNYKGDHKVGTTSSILETMNIS